MKYEHILGTTVSEKSVWRPFLQWASVFGKKAKKNLWYYTLQEGLLTVREQVTKNWTRLSTHKERTPRERWVLPREANVPGGLGYRVFKVRVIA